MYTGRFTAADAGVYRIATVARTGADTIRAPDVLALADTLGADVERAELRASLLRRIADETGGVYYALDNVERLVDDVNLTRSGITVRDVNDLWDMPVVLVTFIAILAAEWSLRRRGGLA